MKKVLTAITLSISALIATSAMAGSQDYHGQHGQQNHWNNKADHGHNNRVNSNYAWRSGQAFPNQFNSSRYHVHYNSYRNLSKPGRYQQWYKVNGDYVLVNERTHRIIRVVR